ncbi:MAG: nucleoside hydrolase [Planctomycetota bacterium]|jgi:inosine-uridine nucleoside N-ribohydrolase
MAIPVIFDTDAGTDIDDLYALALIINHPELELLGVVTADGDTQARLVAKMLRLAGREDVPVRAGPTCPLALAGKPEGAEYQRKLTHCQLVESGDPEHGAEYGDGVEFMLETLSAAERPVTIIGTGPETNLGELLRRADGVQKSKIASLALMGGEVHLLQSEFNIKVDPEAAEIVLTSRLPIFLGTWSVTRQLFFSMAEVDELIGKSQSPFLRALHECTHMWWGDWVINKPGPVNYDVVPVFWAAGERESISCIRLEKLPVELEGRHTRGMTVASPYQVETAEKAEGESPEYLAVTDSMDAEALKRRYAELVFG